jgi:hypothetical protein
MCLFLMQLPRGWNNVLCNYKHIFSAAAKKKTCSRTVANSRINVTSHPARSLTLVYNRKLNGNLHTHPALAYSRIHSLCFMCHTGMLISNLESLGLVHSTPTIGGRNTNSEDKNVTHGLHRNSMGPYIVVSQPSTECTVYESDDLHNATITDLHITFHISHPATCASLAAERNTYTCRMWQTWSNVAKQLYTIINVEKMKEIGKPRRRRPGCPVCEKTLMKLGKLYKVHWVRLKKSSPFGELVPLSSCH